MARDFCHSTVSNAGQGRAFWADPATPWEPLPGDPDAHLDPASEAASVMAQERGAAMATLPVGEVHSGRSDHVARSRATANFVSVKQ
jgi:hypothetical protein